MPNATPAPTPAAPPTPRPSARVDGCPECVYNTEAPKSWLGAADDVICAYVCSDCGHAWLTSWRA